LSVWQDQLMIEDKVLLSEYLSESEQLLDSLLADLDALSAQVCASQSRSRSVRGRKKSDLDIGLLNRIFRSVHSLKGLSGMMGLAQVQRLAHQFEDILDDLRLARLALDPEVAASLQEAGAGLASVVASAASGLPCHADVERLSQILATIAARPRASFRAEPVDLASLGFTEREHKLLTEYERHRINEALSAGKSLYAISVRFEISDLDTRYRALNSKLSEIGELIATLPVTVAEPTLVAFKLIFATELKGSELKRAVEAFGGGIRRLNRSPWQRAGAALSIVSLKQRRRAGRDRQVSTSEQPQPTASSFAQQSLRPISQSVRVELSQIDELSGLAHELSIETDRLASMAAEAIELLSGEARRRFELKQSIRRVRRRFLEFEERLVELRMVSLAQTFTRAARLAEQLARELGKSVSVEVSGRGTQIDKMIADRIADPIYHLLRNAIDHGIEPPEQRRLAGKPPRGRLRLEAGIEGTRALIAISDDGAGIDPEQVRRRALEIGAISEDEQLSDEELLRLIFRPGFSTAGEVSEVSGRGVGLDAVERTLYELGGEIRVVSEKGKGTRFELVVPTTLVMISAFIVGVGDWQYAINVGQIIELIYVDPSEITGSDGRRRINWRGSTIPLVELKYLLGLGGARRLPISVQEKQLAVAGIAVGARVLAFVTRFAEKPVAIAVERFSGQREIIVRRLGPLAQKIKGVVGAVDLEGGETALVLDLPSLLLLRSVRL
jgi:two-component system chemotaxis sensor kinase CheA